MSILSSHLSTSGPSSFSDLATAVRAITTAAISWSKPAAMCWRLVAASAHLPNKNNDDKYLKLIPSSVRAGYVYTLYKNFGFFCALLSRYCGDSDSLLATGVLVECDELHCPRLSLRDSTGLLNTKSYFQYSPG